MKKKLNSAAWIFFLLFFDVCAFYTSVLFNQIVSKETILHLNINHLQLIKDTFPLLLIFIPLIGFHGLYTARLPFWDEIKDITKITALLVFIVVLIVGSQNINAKHALIWSFFRTGIFLVFFMSVFRMYGKRLLYGAGIGLERLIILGAGETGIAVLKSLSKESNAGHKIFGFLDDKPEMIGRKISVGSSEYEVHGQIKDVSGLIKKFELDAVIIAMPHLSKEKLAEITNNIHRFVKNVFVIPDIKGIALLNTELYHYFMEQLFVLKINNNLKSVLNRTIKTFFDYILSLLMLPFIAIGMICLGILIRIDSPGPVFYSQPRIGQNGRSFRIYKFRTMYTDAENKLKEMLDNDHEAKKEWDKSFKFKNDPRITTVGGFLRKTSLDELPQIFNVLRGDMSLVGPRPVVQKEIDDYYKTDARDYFLVKPGITGLWQVSGRSDTSYDYRVSLDTWYVMNWSLWLDMVILFKTIKVVFKGDGAY